ncbi:hypothetical protein R3P38DRAFT_2982499 [Favolaschia claudopus]|uniref:Secreted protein n=1 Tax=Favolaschia claudopus TaxID=2862362 RepID=A0AAW0AZW6_9AGAR
MKLSFCVIELHALWLCLWHRCFSFSGIFWFSISRVLPLDCAPRSSLISADSALYTSGAAAGLELSSGASPIPQHPTDKRRLLFIRDNHATPCGAPCNEVRRRLCPIYPSVCNVARSPCSHFHVATRMFPITSAG